MTWALEESVEIFSLQCAPTRSNPNKDTKNETAIYTGSKLGPGKDADSHLWKADGSRSRNREKSGRLCNDDKGKGTELFCNAKTGTKLRNWMMVDSNTLLTTALSDKMYKQTALHVLISATSNLIVMAIRRGRCTVTWNGEMRKTKAVLFETLLSELLNYSLLPACSLVCKVIAVAFTAGNVILIDIVDKYSIVGSTVQSSMTSTKLPA